MTRSRGLLTSQGRLSSPHFNEIHRRRRQLLAAGRTSKSEEQSVTRGCTSTNFTSRLCVVSRFSSRVSIAVCYFLWHQFSPTTWSSPIPPIVPLPAFYPSSLLLSYTVSSSFSFLPFHPPVLTCSSIPSKSRWTIEILDSAVCELLAPAHSFTL